MSFTLNSQFNNQDVYLKSNGTPVLVGSSLSDDNNKTSDGFQLTNNGVLTEAGDRYCTIMGVQRDASSLVKFILVARDPSVVMRYFKENDSCVPA